jgi:hypothetical protein
MQTSCSGYAGPVAFCKQKTQGTLTRRKMSNIERLGNWKLYPASNGPENKNKLRKRAEELIKMRKTQKHYSEKEKWKKKSKIQIFEILARNFGAKIWFFSL